MGSAKKFKHIYSSSQAKNSPPSQEDVLKDKQTIEAYRKKIDELLKDPKMQKKAALILENLIKKGSK